MTQQSVRKTDKSTPIICIKVGGNALVDESTKKSIISQVCDLHHRGFHPVIIHGGGIEIQQLLDDTGTESQFIGGHRKTDARSIRYVEMALSGAVNKELVGLLNKAGVKAVGISGRDAGMVKAKKRKHTENGEEFDLGFVGDVDVVDTSLVQTLTAAGYLPVISPVSAGEDGHSFNINADMFAGHLAGALQADKFIALTNIDGLLRDVKDPDSIIESLTPAEARSLFGSVIQGGMIPKIEACLIAIEKGVKSAHIVNGTKEGNLLRIFKGTDKVGTTISKNSKSQIPNSKQP
ncbi:acetylglutamate kinase [Rhodohalobacter mucosus]|uniref:acetylglutamate kinase n=1 Tax=Rhodohalobacter mucosus TaxID=2079485 RepID=UPI001304F9AB|nr:acetylglutamate kinase [Rhodohalobacter mucosus]